jgi:hypothetical protein
MISIRKIILYSAVLLATGCGHDNTPDGVAEEFLFRYLIELNQQGAQELSTGLAEQKLEREIEDLRSVRMQPDLDLSGAKPFIDYQLKNKQARADQSVTFFYDVTIESKGGYKSDRQFILSTVEIEGKWKVNNFDTFSPDIPEQ